MVRGARFLALALLLLLPSTPSFAPGEEELPNLPPPLRVHALTHARIVPSPGEVLEDGTVVLRNGRIDAIGASIRIPPDARVWDLTGRTIYAGLIDAATGLGLPERPKPGRDEESDEPPAQRQPSRRAEPPPAGATHEVTRVRPEVRAADRIQIDAKALKSWRGAGFTTVVAAMQEGIFRGSAALLNLGDGELNENLVRDELAQTIGFDRSGFGERDYPASLMGAMAVIRQALLDAGHHRAAWRAYEAAPGGADRPEVNRALAALAPLAEGKQLAVFDTGSLFGLVRAGGLAREFGLRALAVGGGDEYLHLDWVKAAGLPLIVPVSFPPIPAVGAEGPAVDIASSELRHWRRAPENPALLARAGLSFALTARGLDRPGEVAGKVREAIERGLDPATALAALTAVPARLVGIEDRLGTLAPGKIANLTVTDGDLFAKGTKVVEVWIDGMRYETQEEKKTPDGDGGEGNDEPAAEPGSPGKPKRGREENEATPAAPEIPWAPAPGPLGSPDAVLVRGAVIWTSGPAGRIDGADLLAAGGKISAVGRGLAAPAGALVIDAGGRHITPGLIDAHSHSATAESVNEGTRAVTAEVRVADVLDPDDPTIYRLLAGGLTTANVLHGSANPIGGQNAIIKIRTGRTPEGLLVAGAPPGIKFALGENPKQSNWGERFTRRYPQTRMGVEEVIRQAFLAARDYRAKWERYDRARAAGEAGLVPPRRDLQLEALAEILSGARLVHAHSYRQDEILALLTLADEFGVRLATLQHVLEGYKVGREIAARGTGASTFSDWWAYKFEVYDAIPHNGALMHADGVVVSFNSDSSELARRLNLEAAKAVKYGGVVPEEALKFVTFNPAAQLGLADRVGSLEPGKDADFVIWSGDPLSTRSVVDETWVDGVLYFDRERDPELRRALAAERDALLAAARAAKERDKGKRKGKDRHGRGEVGQ